MHMDINVPSGLLCECTNQKVARGWVGEQEQNARGRRTGNNEEDDLSAQGSEGGRDEARSGREARVRREGTGTVTLHTVA